VAKEIRPWTRVGDPIVTADGGFGKHLARQTFRKPNGTEQDRSLIIQRDWSVVLPVTVENEVVVVTQYRHGCDRVMIELPAGTANFAGEQPARVMKRELLEETGYTAGQMFPLGNAWMSSGNSPTQVHLFLAVRCRKVLDQKLDQDEDIKLELVPLTRWISRVVSGAITEWSAVVATIRSLPHLRLEIKSTIRHR